MKGGFSLFWPPLTTSLQKFDFKQINFIFHFYCNKKWFQYIHLLSIFSQCHENKTGAGKRKILFSKDVGRRVVDNAMTGPNLWKKFLYLSEKKFLYLLKKFLYFSEKKLISSTEKFFFFLNENSSLTLLKKLTVFSKRFIWCAWQRFWIHPPYFCVFKN